jgi:hypothetical protein
MPSLLKRTAPAAVLALTVVVLAGAPASAATVTIDASVNGSVVTVPSSTNAALGDTVTLANTSVASPPFAVFGDTSCGNGGGFNYGSVSAGQVIPLGTFATPTWNAGDVAHFTLSFGGICTPFDVAVVAASPPPDVAETPFIAGLLCAAVVVFGIGFVVMRRRRHGIVSAKGTP